MTHINKMPPLDELERCYIIDPTAPSGLSRIGSPTKKSGRLGPTGGIETAGYWRVRHRGVIYRVHRIIWTLHYRLDPGEMIIDHRDGNRQNNAVENLRACTIAQNLQNKKSPGRSVHKHLPKGVIKRGTQYQVRIMVNGQLHGERYADLGEASLAAQRVRWEHHGQFSCYD